MYCRSLCILIAGWLLLAPVFAQPAVSWEGLVGLFTQPTAQTLPTGEMALTFSEVRFQQENIPRQSRDTWFSSSLTSALAPRWEVSVSSRNQDYRIYENDTFLPAFVVMEVQLIGSLKYIVTPVEGGKTGIAVGVQDILDDTDQVEEIVTGRGRRFFVVGSYRWAHLGLTHDRQGVGVFAGANLEVIDTVSVIAEWVNRPSFAGIDPPPTNRVNFNLGLRFIPREVQQLRIDVAGVGDGMFTFGFSLSYRFRL